MNMPNGHAGAELLLEHFHRLGDAPDAVPRLRRFILDLAVRGKLVEQDPHEESAEELVKRIQRDTKSRVASGQFREPKSAIEFPWNELPFTVPEHWKWARLIEFSEVSYGFAFDSNKFNNVRRGMPLIRIRDISKTDTEAYTEEAYDRFYIVKQGDMLIGMDGDFNARIWKGKDALLNQRVCRIRAWRHGINSAFIMLPLQMILDHLHGSTSLTTVKHLSAKQMNGVYMPLPALPEQHRIVAKVEELMALCDRLEAAQQQREAERTRLTAAAWQAVVQAEAPAEVSFALEQLPALPPRPAQVKALRQTILDLAVRGRLVEQEEGDEPAEVLLERIGVAQADEQPFAIPSTWIWVETGAISDSRLGKMLDRAKNTGTMRRYLRNINVRWYDFDLSDVHQTPMRDEELADLLLQPGDVLICEGGEPGRAAVWDGRVEEMYFQKALHRVRFPDGVDPMYFTHTIKQSADEGRLADYLTGVGIKHFTGRGLASFVFPLPPLAEQRRIVAKVEELMALCDGLEAALEAGEALRGQVLEAVVRTDAPKAYKEINDEVRLAAEP